MRKTPHGGILVTVGTMQNRSLASICKERQARPHLLSFDRRSSKASDSRPSFLASRSYEKMCSHGSRYNVSMSEKDKWVCSTSPQLEMIEHPRPTSFLDSFETMCRFPVQSCLSLFRAASSSSSPLMSPLALPRPPSSRACSRAF